MRKVWWKIRTDKNPAAKPEADRRTARHNGPLAWLYFFVI
jgi:hypothetical protein